MNNDLNILIPFRGREEHLEVLLPKLKESSKVLNLKYQIYIVEQTVKGLFNKGSVYNAGFKEISKISNCKYWVFHDVDVIEKKPGTFKYQKVDGVCSIYSTTGTNPGGGIFCIDSKSFEKVNGYSNQYVHWGREDQDFRWRTINKKIPVFNDKDTIWRATKEIPQPLVFELSTPEGERVHKTPRPQEDLYYKNIRRYRKDASSIMDEGLNTVKYSLKDSSKKEDFHHILIQI
tara:strand:+ start:377 stop:1072 length:696 start_codon:yes stop_codon:yes gene_type:complete